MKILLTLGGNGQRRGDMDSIPQKEHMEDFMTLIESCSGKAQGGLAALASDW